MTNNDRETKWEGRSWGRVVAAPHEFLIQMRRGRLLTTGQGASCFKWPSDSVALVSTAIRKLGFVADQVTRERIGVEVTGLAVYRIVDPLVAFRMIDTREDRLSEVLRDMFVGATRRIVASLSLDECITHRKERVAVRLMEEIAPVLRGNGEVSDMSTQGWGVAIDTIEIQNVRVLSEGVFRALQAPYKESLALAALRAKESVEEERARIDLERRRTEERARRELMADEDARIEAERERRHATLEFERAEARRAADETAELTRMAMETQRLQGELDAFLAKTAHASRGELSDRQLQELALRETLPELARAMRGMFGEVDLHVAQGQVPELLSFLGGAIREVGRSSRELAGDARVPSPPRPE